MFNSSRCSSLPPHILSYPQLRIVKEAWLEACLRQKALVDETPFLLQPISCTDSSTPLQSSINYIEEWQNDIRESMETNYEQLSSKADTLFKVVFSFPSSVESCVLFSTYCRQVWLCSRIHP